MTRPPRQRRVLWVASAASLLGHAILLWGLASSEAPPRKQPRPAAITWLEVKKPTPPSSAPAPTPAQTEAPTKRSAPSRPPRAAAPTPSSPPSPESAPTPEAQPPAERAAPAASAAPNSPAKGSGVARAEELDLRLHLSPTARPSTALPQPGDLGMTPVPGARIGARAPGLPEGVRANGDGTYAYSQHGFSAVIERDGTVVFDNDIPIGAFTGTLVSFDLTEAVMLLHGDDPFLADKLHFLKRTGSMRAQMCAEAQKDSLDVAVRSLRRDLARIFADPSRTLSQKKKLLFDLWDQCAENDSNPNVAKAAAMARATVLGFIREKLPARSEDRYQEEEIAELNRGRISRELFRPY